MRTTTRRCQARRRKWRGNVLGKFACGRKATAVMTYYVGTAGTGYVCDDPECHSYLSGGYPTVSRSL